MVEKELGRAEKEILLYMYKTKPMINSNPSSLDNIYSIFREKYDIDPLKEYLRNIAWHKFIELKDEKFDIFGIPNAYTINLIKEELGLVVYMDLIRQKFLETWSWLWEHFIITVMVSIVTAYLTTKFII